MRVPHLLRIILQSDNRPFFSSLDSPAVGMGRLEVSCRRVRRRVLMAFAVRRDLVYANPQSQCCIVILGVMAS